MLEAVGFWSEAVGFGSEAVGFGSEAVGFGSETVGFGSEAVGFGSEAVGFWSEAIGFRSEAIGFRSEAIGFGSETIGIVSERVGFPVSIILSHVKGVSLFPVELRLGNKEGEPVQQGDRLKVTGMKADGVPYRWFTATVELVERDHIVVSAPAGEPVYEPSGSWTARMAFRTHFWLDRPYNLLESPSMLYVNITSRPIIQDGEIRYHDYELDVIKRPGQPAEVIDQDEFDAAIATYGYTPTFQEEVRKAVDEAIHLVEHWGT